MMPFRCTFILYKLQIIPNNLVEYGEVSFCSKSYKGIHIPLDCVFSLRPSTCIQWAYFILYRLHVTPNNLGEYIFFFLAKVIGKYTLFRLYFQSAKKCMSS